MMTDTLFPPRNDAPPPGSAPTGADPSAPTQQLPPPAYPRVPAAPAPAASPDDRSRGWVTMLAAALVAALVSAGTTAALVRSDPGAPTVDPAPAADTGGEAEEASQPVTRGNIAEVAAAVSPSVVFIEVAGATGGQGSGSGVVLREDGYVLTNAHVVENAAAVRVTLPDGATYDAEVVGGDASSDLAVLELDGASDLPVPDFADATPRVGDMAVAIGSPFGLEGSVTSGIISALNRSVPGSSQSLVDMIQTDAAINPGNSGGALTNDAGEVIGINTAILSPSGANDGIGFAIPIQSALPLAEQIIEKGYVEHAQLGIQGRDIDPETAELYDLGVDSGALVAMVASGSAAEEAGLERGDIITAIDEAEVTTMADLVAQIMRHAPGDEVTLTVMRDGETTTLDVTLGSAPREAP